MDGDANSEQIRQKRLAKLQGEGSNLSSPEQRSQISPATASPRGFTCSKPAAEPKNTPISQKQKVVPKESPLEIAAAKFLQMSDAEWEHNTLKAILQVKLEVQMI